MNTRFKIFFFLIIIFFLKLSNAAPEFSTSPGLKFLVGPSANFSASDKWVQIKKHRDANNKLMIYAHGGAGLTDSDKLRVSLFEKLGFDTISFDAFAMNELDGEWVNRNLTDRAKQDLIMNVMNGAVDFGMSQVSYTDIVFYGQSNGAKVVINSIQRYDPNPRIKLILSEAPPPSGYPFLPDVQTPTVLFLANKITGEGRVRMILCGHVSFLINQYQMQIGLKSNLRMGAPLRSYFIQMPDMVFIGEG